MGRGQEAMEVGGEAREEPRLGLEKGRASGPGGLTGLPVGVAGFPQLRPVNNIGVSHSSTSGSSRSLTLVAKE